MFSVAEFMGALHRDEFWLCLTEQEEEYFENHRWL
tara:strand:+ start:2843 stop:2947 length:105 start_codon:yes stop_codon:yes gene_type:complete